MAVSVQQAAANAAVAFLREQIPGVDIHPRWPSRDFGGKAITLIPAGSRQDTFVEPRVLSKENQGDVYTRALWQIAECTQPFQLDVWTTTFSERDDLVARLDEALRKGFAPIPSVRHKNPFSAGFFVNLADGWEETQSTAKFQFDSPNLEDTVSSVGVSQYRATYRGTAWMKLAMYAVSPRQRIIYLRSYLDGTQDPDRPIS